MTQVIRCDACGGRVVYDASREAARCLFCGSVALRPDDDGEALPRPDAMLPFEVDRPHAERRFRRWARSSWWRPRPLRTLEVELSELLLPVWSVAAALETHWAGLRRADTRSGARPCAGVEHSELQTRVPASMGIDAAELDALRPFRDAAAVPFDQGAPHEVPALSERAASEAARARLVDQHRDRIMRTHRLTRCNCDASMRIRHARLLMVPVYIGSVRYRDRPWRFIVNGQTGAVTGRAPVDRLKVAMTAIFGIAIFAAWWLLHGRG